MSEWQLLIWNTMRTYVRYLWQMIHMFAIAAIRHVKNEFKVGTMMSNPKTAHNFAMASMVCGVISALIGGVLLDIIGLIFGYLAFRSARQNGPHAQDQVQWMKTMALARNAMLLCLILGILNLVFVIMYLPYADQIVGSMTNGQIGSGSASSSGGSLF